jgi:hypothetical protein
LSLFHFLGGAKVPTKAIAVRALPAILVAAILALSFFVVKVPINPKLVACPGYGPGYGYTAGPPSVTGINPTAGPIAGGTSVAVTGQGFCNFTTTVNFGTSAAGFSINSDTSITAISPAHAAGTVDVTVTNAAGTSAISAADQFTYSAFTSYFQWYDKASSGFLNDNIHLINPSATATAHVQVSLPGATPVSISVPPGVSTYTNFPQGTIGGPVSVNSDITVKASQRVQYNQSFNEVWSASVGSTTSYINWFDNASAGFLNDNIHLLNPGTATANVTVSLGVTGVTPKTATVAPGAETYVSFPAGTIGGPITVTSNVAVLASQRVQFNQTFNEVWSQPGTAASTRSLINWFDLASDGFVNDNIHVVNPGTASATVNVSMPGAATQTATVAAGAETYLHFPAGTIGGPVTVASSTAVLASQRVQFQGSFNEVWAQAPNLAATKSHVSWFDKASTGFMNVNIHLLNPDALTPAVVTVSVPGAVTQTATVQPGTETYVTFPAGTIGGPVTVTVQVGPNVLASERTQFFQTFNEIWSL